MWSRKRKSQAGIVSPVWRALREWADETPVRLRVAGDCMAPVLEDGERVEVTRAARYWPGDILVVKRATDAPATVHRLVGWVGIGNRSRFVTWPDNSEKADSAFTRDQIIGRVSARVDSTRPFEVSFLDRLRALGFFFRFIGIRIFKRR